MKKWRNLINDERVRIELLFIIISVLFGVIMSCCRIASDDAVHYAKMGTTIGEQLDYSISWYNTWSSRLIVNFLWFAILGHGKFVWAIYMIVCMYVLLKGLYKLFFDDFNLKNALFVAGIAMLFPMGVLISAGWIATSVTYFGPQAFGILALVPIRKVAKKAHIGAMEFLLYCIAIVYAANTEQMCVVLLFIYSIAIGVFWITKRMNWRLCILYVLNIASLIFIVTCPGNYARKGSETAYWFPTYDMLNTIDKIDIGLSTTLKWMFADGQAFIIIICGLIMYFVWKKYEELVYRVISAIPFVTTLLLGPLNSFTTRIFPNIANLSADVDYYGAFNVASMGRGIGPIQFGFFASICVCIIASLILVNNHPLGLMIDVVLVCAGFGSRLMMGFSPTIYASSYRTYTTLIVCLLAVGVHIYSENIEMVKDRKVISCFSYLAVGCMCLGFVELISLVATALY